MKKVAYGLLVAWALAAGCGGGGKTDGDVDQETEDGAGEDADAVQDPDADPDGGDPDAAEDPGEGGEDPAGDDAAEEEPLDDHDDDGDGFSEAEGDCDDGLDSVFPGARETCGDGVDQDCFGGDLPCFSDPVQTGQIVEARLNECSGIGWGRSQPILWANNDSGDSARFFGFLGDGTFVAVVNLQGADATDWEDMGTAPGPDGGRLLFFADIGDNGASRDHVTVYRLPEPAIDLGSAPVEIDVTDWERYHFQYADGAHNAETFFVDPATLDHYILTKAGSGFSQLFVAASPAADSTTTMTEVASLTFGAGELAGSPETTSGDISEDGNRILVRTYSRVFLFLRYPWGSVADALLGEVYQVPQPAEPQGEAVAFAPDALIYTTVSEGTSPSIYTMSAVVP
jgi:hypothetical protein